MKKYITFAKTTDAVQPYEPVHRKIAYQAACESIVLLENDGVLPVNPGKIALYGAGAAHTIKGGTGSGEVNERYSVNILDGLTAAGFEITTQKWLQDYEYEYKRGLEEAQAQITAAMKRLDLTSYMNMFLKSYTYPFGRRITEHDVKDSCTDTCVFVVARQSGEGADRRLENMDFTLSDIERENIRFCAEHYAKTIVVLNVGSSFDAEFFHEIPGINALIYLCQLGTEGGTAFADVFSGKVTPSGKLTDTWAKSYSDIPYSHQFSYLNGDLENEDYLEDIYVGYRYFNTFGIEPRYPFGYGRSYTDFEISFGNIYREKDVIKVRAKVRNIGTKFSGKEVVQLYASCPDGKLTKEYQRLCAFGKTKVLAPGEETSLLLEFPFRYLASYDEDTASHILEAGDYVLRLGSDSLSTTSCAVLTLPETICISKHKNICPVQKELKLLTPKSQISDSISGLPKLTVFPECVSTAVYTYEELPVCPDLYLTARLKTLTLQERVELTIGAGLKDMLLNSSYIKVPGVAGNTTSKLLHKHIVNIALADGPAGLRVLRRSTIAPGGMSKMIDMQFDMMKYLPEVVKKVFCGNPEKDQIYYQYCTAFPVEAALAQTWNEEILEQVGKAVSREMDEYGVTFWLAPALNIHRNPLCGRNYEYYSEDPVVSGKMAAAITRGVQMREGCFVTLKHFCANNQEDNRNHVSSNMSERALREIYLRGFEIAVREADPKGMMSSYNKVNGVYTSNSKELLTDVLRHEWGFGGLVMTDWTATNKGQADPAGCIAAGNDLLMPGSQHDRIVIRAALKNRTLSRRDLNRCAGNVLRAIERGRADKRC